MSGRWLLGAFVLLFALAALKVTRGPLLGLLGLLVFGALLTYGYYYKATPPRRGRKP